MHVAKALFDHPRPGFPVLSGELEIKGGCLAQHSILVTGSASPCCFCAPLWVSMISSQASGRLLGLLSSMGKLFDCLCSRGLPPCSFVLLVSAAGIGVSIPSRLHELVNYDGNPLRMYIMHLRRLETRGRCPGRDTCSWFRVRAHPGMLSRRTCSEYARL